MFNIIKRMAFIIGLLVIVPVSFSQDEESFCSEEFIKTQTELMTDTEAYPAFDNDGEPLDEYLLEKLATQEITTYCDEDREPLIEPDIGIPIETWVITEDTNPQMQSIAKEFDESGECFISYMYVDHEAGTTFDLQFFCEVDDEGNINITSRMQDEKETSLKIRYESVADMRFTPLTNEQLIELGLPITPFWHHIYVTEDYDQLRMIRDLDPIRYPGYPDDIEFYLFDNELPDLQTELIFGRLEMQLDPPEFFVVELLNQPFSDYGVNLGDLVVVQLAEYEGETLAVYIGKLQQ